MITLCTTCYKSHGGPCPPDPGTVNPNVVNFPEVPMDTDQTAPTAPQTPVADAVAALEAKNAELTARLASKEARFKALQQRSKWTRDDLADAQRLRDDASTQLGGALRANLLLGDRVYQLENVVVRAARDCAGLLIDNADLLAAGLALEDRAGTAEARVVRLNAAIADAHDFARSVYNSADSSRALQGEAAIAIVEMGDAVRGGAL